MKTEEIKFSVTGIFPTPVYGALNVKQITKLELDFVEEQKSKVRIIESNSSSIDNYILEQPIFKDLKNIFEQHLEEYLKKIICPVETNIEIYITQSWLNYTTVNQNHHAHYHANSFLSGVFYFKGDKEIDRISFQKPSQPGLLQVPSKQPNVYNIVNCNLEVDKATLLIFPSTIVHYVEQKKDDNERISLAFNTFVRGNIGHSNSLTQLKL